MSTFLRLLIRNRLAAAGGCVLAAVVLLALMTPLLPLQPPNVTNTADRFMRPFSDGHLPRHRSSGTRSAVETSLGDPAQPVRRVFSRRAGGVDRDRPSA